MSEWNDVSIQQGFSIKEVHRSDHKNGPALDFLFYSGGRVSLLPPPEAPLRHPERQKRQK